MAKKSPTYSMTYAKRQSDERTIKPILILFRAVKWTKHQLMSGCIQGPQYLLIT